MPMTGHLNILLPAELLAKLDDYAAKHGIKRSAAARVAIWQLLSTPSPYIAPTLPNWQVEAWTGLLRGMFRVKHLVLTSEVKAMLVEAVAALNERDAQVLRLRFGLSGPRHTLAEVAVVMGVHRSRVHQVEKTALARVRGWCRGRGIWDLLKLDSI